MAALHSKTITITTLRFSATTHSGRQKTIIR
jgi:hypothetical protein